MSVLVGKPAPDTTGTDLDGQPFRLSDLRGQIVVDIQNPLRGPDRAARAAIVF